MLNCAWRGVSSKLQLLKNYLWYTHFLCIAAVSVLLPRRYSPSVQQNSTQFWVQFWFSLAREWGDSNVSTNKEEFWWNFKKAGVEQTTNFPTIRCSCRLLYYVLYSTRQHVCI